MSDEHRVSIFTIVGLVLIALKLFGVITWPWLWVLAPLWGWVVIVALIVAIAVIFEGIGE